MRIGNETLKARVAEIEQVLKDEALEALVVFSNGSALGAQSKVHGYTRYLTNFDSHNTSSVLVLRLGHAPSLVIAINPSRVNKARSCCGFPTCAWSSHRRLGQKSPPSSIPIWMASGASVSLAAARFPPRYGRRWQPALKNAEWVDFAPHIDKRRIAKTDLQLSFPRRAAEICDAIFQTVQRDVRKAPKGYQLQAAMENTAREEGCEYCQAWLTIAPRADYARFFVEECGRVPQQGDQVIPGIYLTYDGHWGHAIRTGTVGRPTADHRRIDGNVRGDGGSLPGQAIPGEDLREAVAAIDRTVDKYYPDPGFPRSRPGHGLGLSYEDPVVTNAFIHSWDRGTAPATRRQPHRTGSRAC